MSKLILRYKDGNARYRYEATVNWEPSLPELVAWSIGQPWTQKFIVDSLDSLTAYFEDSHDTGTATIQLECADGTVAQWDKGTYTLSYGDAYTSMGPPDILVEARGQMTWRKG